MPVDKKETLKKKKKQVISFFKSRNGKIFAGVCAVAFVLGIGFYGWNQGAQVRKGLAFCEKGEYAEAQTCFKNAILADNMSADNYYYLGMAYLGTGAYEDAQKQFQLTLNLEKENQEAYRGLGIAAAGTEDYEAAIDYFNQALDYAGLRVDQTEYDILWYRADAEMALEDYEAAAQTYSSLLELEGDQALLRYQRGAVYCLLGKKKEAKADFDAAVKMKGNGYDLFWNIYDSMNAAGWKEDGTAYLKLAQEAGYVDTSQCGSEQDVRRYQGMIAYACGDYEQAISLLSSATLEKDDKAQFYLALAYEGNADYGNALSIYLKDVSGEHVEAAAYNRIARYFIRRGQGKEALTYLEQGIKSCSEEEGKGLYYNLVSAQEACGDYEEALNALTQYEARYGKSSESEKERTFLKERIR